MALVVLLTGFGVGWVVASVMSLGVSPEWMCGAGLLGGLAVPGAGSAEVPTGASGLRSGIAAFPTSPAGARAAPAALPSGGAPLLGLVQTFRKGQHWP